MIKRSVLCSLFLCFAGLASARQQHARSSVKLTSLPGGLLKATYPDDPLSKPDTVYIPAVQVVPNGLGGMNFLYLDSAAVLSRQMDTVALASTRLFPETWSGLKTVYLDHMLPTTEILDGKLGAVGARFHQPPDSLLTFLDSDEGHRERYGTLQNKFSDAHRLSINYFIRPFRHPGRLSNVMMRRTDHLLSLVDAANAQRRDSILNTEFDRYIAFLQTKNTVVSGDSCFSKDEAIAPATYSKTMLEADSVAIVQYITPAYKTCAIGLNKAVILFKKDAGYIIIGYGLLVDWNRKTSFQEASRLLDSLISQTWGMIRFEDE